MGELIIYYDALVDAASKASKAAAEFDAYATRLKEKVANKLDSYSGGKTGNLYSAETEIDNKIAEAEQMADAFYAYSTAIGNNGFIQTAKAADAAVKSEVTTKIGEFRDTYGIKENPITKWICDLVCVLNETALGRLLKDIADSIAIALEHLWNDFTDWYNYWGGEYLLKDIAVAVAAAVVAVAAVVLVVVTGGAALAIISAAIAAVVACLNLGATIYNSVNAYGAMQDGDPSWAKRYSNRDGFTDTLRKESDSKIIHGIALAVDGVEFAGQIIGLVDTLRNLGGAIKNFKNFMTALKNDPFKNASFQSWFKSDMFSFKSISNSLTGDLISNLSELKGGANVKTVCQVIGSLNSTWENITFAKDMFSGDKSFVDIALKATSIAGSMADNGMKENGFTETFGRNSTNSNGTIDRVFRFDMAGDVVGNGDNSLFSSISGSLSSSNDIIGKVAGYFN
ncbi:MAG: hypothetical protein J6B50_07590 [Lachnospiraceae bacterium]|nr:hypothetical protein [Lachnospiraceae bacterium]MBP3506772.1 hypothetical protein [Lachnospiraceae bacterium]